MHEHLRTVSFLDQITVLILTFNEEANIGRTLEGVSWAKRIVVVDSGSTDATLDLVREHPHAKVAFRPFDTHQAQWNFGLEHCGPDSEWILALDADYLIENRFRAVLEKLNPPADVSGYSANFRYRILGRTLRGDLYPPVVVLYRHQGAHYVQNGHTQRLVTPGRINRLQVPIYHDDRKPLSRWLGSQLEYAKLEADYLLVTPRRQLRRSDRVRRLGWPAPILVFLYTLFVKRCILDGRAGWYYVLQRTLAETLIALQIVDRRLRADMTAGKPTASGRDLPPLGR